ncbi:MAG: MBL fold metallo-hydrolase [bacterium]
MSIILKCLTVGYLPTNCYIVVCKKTLEAIIVDPGINEGEEGRIIDVIRGSRFSARYIVNTHGHPDHTAGNRVLKANTRADILIHHDDAPLLTDPWLGAEESPAFKVPHRCPICGKEEMVRLEIDGTKARTVSGCGVIVLEAEISPPADRTLGEGDKIRFGQTGLEVIHTPGHTRGGVSLYSADERFVFTGDTLFADSCGRTDLAGGSEENMIRSLRKLMRLPAETVVYPGHRSSTTIERARAINPCVKLLQYNEGM